MLQILRAAQSKLQRGFAFLKLKPFDLVYAIADDRRRNFALLDRSRDARLDDRIAVLILDLQHQIVAVLFERLHLECDLQIDGINVVGLVRILVVCVILGLAGDRQRSGLQEVLFIDDRILGRRIIRFGFQTDQIPIQFQDQLCSIVLCGACRIRGSGNGAVRCSEVFYVMRAQKHHIAHVVAVRPDRALHGVHRHAVGQAIDFVIRELSGFAHRLLHRVERTEAGFRSPISLFADGADVLCLFFAVVVRVLQVSDVVAPALLLRIGHVGTVRSDHVAVRIAHGEQLDHAPYRDEVSLVFGQLRICEILCRGVCVAVRHKELLEFDAGCRRGKRAMRSSSVVALTVVRKYGLLIREAGFVLRAVKESGPETAELVRAEHDVLIAFDRRQTTHIVAVDTTHLREIARVLADFVNKVDFGRCDDLRVEVLHIVRVDFAMGVRD